MSTRIFYPIQSQSITELDSSCHWFNDARLEKRCMLISSQLDQKRTNIVGQLFPDWSDQMSTYRFLNNDKVKLPELIHHCTTSSRTSLEDKHILAVIDGSSISLSCKKKHAKQHRSAIGVIEDNRTPGFYIYPCLLLERGSNQVLGLADICLFTRPCSQLSSVENEQQRKLRSKLPFEQKESSVWSHVALNAAQKLCCAASVTFVMDRGADIYEVMQALTTHQQDFLIRVQHNRLCYPLGEGKAQRIKTLLTQQADQSCRLQAIRALCHKSHSTGRFRRRKARVAKLAIRYLPVRLKAKDTGQPLDKTFWVIHVEESASSVPEGESPIQWTLITSKPIEDIQQAWQLVDDYLSRWWIEQLFRTLKKDGIDIESTELEHPDAIKKYTIMALKASAKALKLVAVRDQEDKAAVEEMFDQQEQEVLEELEKRLEGNTVKTKNPYNRKSLAWAAWIIARLGGWKGYQSQRPPGPTIMTRGLEKFEVVLWLKLPPT